MIIKVIVCTVLIWALIIILGVCWMKNIFSWFERAEELDRLDREKKSEQQ